MNEITLESLAKRTKRVEALEAATFANRLPNPDHLPANADNNVDGIESGKLDSAFLNASDQVFKQHEEILRRLA